jgi:hypothetical protein
LFVRDASKARKSVETLAPVLPTWLQKNRPAAPYLHFRDGIRHCTAKAATPNLSMIRQELAARCCYHEALPQPGERE